MTAVLNLNASTVLVGILIGEIEKFDPAAKEDIRNRTTKNIDAYWNEQRRLKNIIKSPAFWRGISQALSLGFNRVSTKKERTAHLRSISEQSSKIVVDAKHAAIASYLDSHPDIALKISIPEGVKDILRPMLEKTPVPKLQPYLGL